MTEMRRRRLRALRHLPHTRLPADVEGAIAALVRDLPALTAPDAGDLVARLRTHLLAGETAAAARLLLGDDRAAVPPARVMVLGLAAIPLVLAGCLALLVLAICGQLVAFGVVYGVLLVAPRTVLARFRTRWGCLPARHARIVHDALALRAMATALAHYRAVRSIALADDEGCKAWGEANAALRGDGALEPAVAHELARDHAIWEVVRASTVVGQLAAARMVRGRR